MGRFTAAASLPTGSPQTDDIGAGGNVSAQPYFDFNVPRNVTTAVGQTAFLHCRVEQLGDKGVSERCNIFIPFINKPLYFETPSKLFSKRS
jgi:hypothetical protein